MKRHNVEVQYSVRDVVLRSIDITWTIARLVRLISLLSCDSIQDSVLTTLPHIGHFMAALTCGLLVDHVRESKIVSTTTARKLVVYTGALCVSP